jgi:hypothetical protein
LKEKEKKKKKEINKKREEQQRLRGTTDSLLTQDNPRQGIKQSHLAQLSFSIKIKINQNQIKKIILL